MSPVRVWLLATGMFGFIAAGCRGATEPREVRIDLQTDRTAYTATHIGGEGVYARYGFRVVAHLENRGNVTVYLARCEPDSPSPMYGVGLVETTTDFGSAYNGGWLCTGHEQHVEVRPGESRTDELMIGGPHIRDASGPRGSLTGTMRLFYRVARCGGVAECRVAGSSEIDAHTVRSNEFTVEVAEIPPSGT